MTEFRPASGPAHCVAILGAGIGAQHLDGWLALPDRFSVRVVCDLDASKAESLASRVAGCTASQDLEAVLADREIDIVDVCLPPGLHTEVTLRALAAGKHVVCEKPMAPCVLDADRMVKAARTAGRVLLPVFQYRFGREIDRLRALVDRGLAGRPLVASVETHWNRGADYYGTAWRGTWAGELGGAVLSHAIHAHDLVTLFFGRVAEVAAVLDTRVNPVETEDCAAVAMRTASGALVSSSITLGSATDMSRLRLVFSELTAESGRNPYAPGQEAWTFTARDPQRQDAVDAALRRDEPQPEGRAAGYAGLFASLATALSGDSAGLVTPDDGVHSLELAAAIYHSARAGARVSLPLDRALPICSRLAPG